MINIKKYILPLILLLTLASCSSSVRFSKDFQRRPDSETSKINTNGNDSNPETNVKSGTIYRGVASYYSDKFSGRTTASGEIYSPDAFTAAHKSLKFGTKLRVTNIANSNSVVVVVNDRGPNVPDRIIDLSKAAAIMLDMTISGTAEVEIEIID